MVTEAGAEANGGNERGFYFGKKRRGDLIQSHTPCSHSLLLPQTDYWALKAPSAEADFFEVGAIGWDREGGRGWWGGDAIKLEEGD